MKNIIKYKRFKSAKHLHFHAAKGYNCPNLPLGKIGSDTKFYPDYEIVKVVEASDDCKFLKGRRVMITWGLNIPKEKWPEITQVIAVNDLNSDFGEIVLATCTAMSKQSSG